MKNEKVLALIPARSGSKGLPGKNIKLFGGRPLIEWTIQSALNASCIDNVIVTTDCKKIADISRRAGAVVPFLRPPELSSDTATTADTVYHALNNIVESFDTLILLQPTSPLRNSIHIDNAYSIFSGSTTSSVVSVNKVDKNPNWCFWINDDNKLVPVLSENNERSRRQDLPSSFSLNGAIYIVDILKFLKEKRFIYEDSLPFIMDKKSSIDIDDHIDFKIAQILLGEK